MVCEQSVQNGNLRSEKRITIKVSKIKTVFRQLELKLFWSYFKVKFDFVVSKFKSVLNVYLYESSVRTQEEC